ncbi:cutinase family protein [Nocardia sp. GAS34]|uniref:cutinase family protein n=1 Tax=unclassified Nocardia TaxID=2637762 RepID=UPI003D1EAC02
MTATAVTLAALGASVITAPGSVAAPPIPIGPCPALYLLGVQGTGQSAPAASPTADTGVLGALLGPVEAAVPGLVQHFYLPYEAGFGGIDGRSPASYTNSATAAISDLDDDAAQVLSRCPRTQLGVVGYSQGAQIVSQWARKVGAGRDRVRPEQVAATLLYADPERRPNSPLFPGRPGQTVPDRAPGTTGGAVAGVRITNPPAPGAGIADDNAQYGALTGRVLDTCDSGDLVCAGPEHAALLRLGAEIAAQANLSNPLAALGSLQSLLSAALGNAWTSIVLDDFTLTPGNVDYTPRARLSQRLIDAADPRLAHPTPAQAGAAAQRWGQIVGTVAAHPLELLPRLVGELTAAWGQLAADNGDLVNPAVWIRFISTVAAHDDYALSGQLASGIAWLIAAAHDLAGRHP